ncbi:MAG: hypothetical protein ACO2PN_00025, partial [Pyrobaculum sp.]
KTLYDTAKDVFEHVKVTVQRLVELFVEAVTRVLAWVDEHKAHLFLTAAVTAGAITQSTALNLWGLVELEKLAYAASLTPFVFANVEEYSREEVLNRLRNASDPYKKFKEIAEAANEGKVKLAEPWESLRKLILPNESEKMELMRGGRAGLYSKFRKDENYKRALFYAALALEEALAGYKSALRKLEEAFDVYRKDVKEREKVVQKEEVGVEPFKQDMYVTDLKQIKQLAEDEEVVFKNALRTLREKLNEYAVRYGLRGLLNVEESEARKLAEAEHRKLSKFKNVNFGTKAYAALIAYREYVLGRKSAYGTVAWHWLEVGGFAWLLYYAPSTAYIEAEKAKPEKPAAVEELVAEAFRRLFLKPGADRYRGFIEELIEEFKEGDKLALMLEDKTKSSYVFRLFRLEEGDKLVELEGVKLGISRVGEGAGVIYTMELDAERRELFRQELNTAEKATEELRGRWPIEDPLLYMLGWVDSDVAISGGLLQMSTSHLWQLAETHALFDWSYLTVLGVGLTLEGPKPQFYARTSLEKLDEAIRKSAEDGWLKMLGIKAESWDGLKRWVVENWDVVVNAAARRLGEEVRSELEALRNKLNDDKVAREVVAPALLLIQAERLGMNETTLKYFAAVVSGAINGDGHVSAAMGVVGLASGERDIALLWATALAAHGIKAEVRRVGSVFQVVVSSSGAVRLARLYFLYGPPLLEGDERVINYKLAEAVKLGAKGLDIRWEGLRRTEKGRVAADLIISVGGAAVKYNIYLLKDAILLLFHSTDRSR